MSTDNIFILFGRSQQIIKYFKNKQTCRILNFGLISLLGSSNEVGTQGKGKSHLTERCQVGNVTSGSF